MRGDAVKNNLPIVREKFKNMIYEDKVLNPFVSQDEEETPETPKEDVSEVVSEEEGEVSDGEEAPKEETPEEGSSEEESV